MLTKKYPSTTRIVGIVLRSYIPNSGERIRTILETDLEDADELFYLNLSLRLLDMDENQSPT